MAEQLRTRLAECEVFAQSVAEQAIANVNWSHFEVALLYQPTIQCFGQMQRVGPPSGVGIMVLTASSEPEVRAQWLTAGAEDCVSHPANTIELAARLFAIARRTHRTETSQATVTVGGLELRFRQREGYLCGKLLELTSNEFDLLASLAQCAGEVLSRERLLELTKGTSDDAFDRSIDVQVSRLRDKLGDDPRDPKLLKTVRGRGYLLVGS